MVRAALFGAAALALTVTAAPAAEAPSSRADIILPGCRAFVDRNSRENLMLQGFCVGTVNGIAAVTGILREFSPLDNDVRRELCSNGLGTTTNDQIVRVVIAYIEARPARMHEPFELLTIEALRTTWPCQ